MIGFRELIWRELRLSNLVIVFWLVNFVVIIKLFAASLYLAVIIYINRVGQILFPCEAAILRLKLIVDNVQIYWLVRLLHEIVLLLICSAWLSLDVDFRLIFSSWLWSSWASIIVMFGTHTIVQSNVRILIGIWTLHTWV